MLSLNKELEKYMGTLLKLAFNATVAVTTAAIPAAMTVGLISTANIAVARESDAHHASPEVRHLHFPRDTSLGLINVEPKVTTSESQPIRAIGEVSLDVPAGSYVRLELAGKVFEQAQLLDLLKDQRIEMVILRCSPMDEHEDEALAQIFQKIAKMRYLTKFCADNSQASDAAIAAFGGNSTIRELSFQYSRANGSCLKQLSSCSNLHILCLRSTGLNDNNLCYLPRFANLSWLDLRNTHLRKIGCSFIGKMKRLELLNAKGNPIDDACIEQLAGLRTLVSCNLMETNVTIKGIRSLVHNPIVILEVPSSVPPSYDAEIRRMFPRIQRLNHDLTRKLNADHMDIFSPRH